MSEHAKFILRVVGNRYLEGRIVESILNSDPHKALELLLILVAQAANGKITGRHSYSQMVDAAKNFCQKSGLVTWQTKALMSVIFWTSTAELHSARMLLSEAVAQSSSEAASFV
jgi:hypothetical protein